MVSRANWKETFTISYNPKELIGRDKVILFEILDFVPEIFTNPTANLTKDGFYRIAWAYLRPLGLAKDHIKE